MGPDRLFPALLLCLLLGAACAHAPAQRSPDEARAAFEAALVARQEGRPQEATATFEALALQQPWSWWGRRSLEELDRQLASLPPAAHEAALNRLEAEGNTGQLLFYSARAWAPQTPQRAIALCLLLEQQDPGSPFRSQCEDLTLTLLPAPERRRYLARLLVPGRRDDPGSFFDGRKQRLEYELARLDAAAGDLAAARQHLLNCVNRYEGAALKDDALFLLADLSKGQDPGLCSRAVKMLVEDYGHSRHLEAARSLDCSTADKPNPR